MKVEEIESGRWNAALDIFADGQRIEFDGVTFYLDREKREIYIGVVTAWQIANLGDNLAHSELLRGRKVFEYLVENSKKFNEITKGFEPRFSLIHDYGNGAVEICRLENNTIIWNP